MLSGALCILCTGGGTAADGFFAGADFLRFVNAAVCSCSHSFNSCPIRSTSSRRRRGGGAVSIAPRQLQLAPAASLLMEAAATAAPLERPRPRKRPVRWLTPLIIGVLTSGHFHRGRAGARAPDGLGRGVRVAGCELRKGGERFEDKSAFTSRPPPTHANPRRC